jgi:hypothetical protein
MIYKNIIILLGKETKRFVFEALHSYSSTINSLSMFWGFKTISYFHMETTRIEKIAVNTRKGNLQNALVHQIPVLQLSHRCGRLNNTGLTKLLFLSISMRRAFMNLPGYMGYQLT